MMLALLCRRGWAQPAFHAVFRSRWERQRLEQYFTSAQLSAHLRRQVKGRAQEAQIFVRKLGFLCIVWALVYYFTYIVP